MKNYNNNSEKTNMEWNNDRMTIGVILGDRVSEEKNQPRDLILMVDDSAFSLRQAFTVLKKDYNVVCLRSARKALQYLREQDNELPDLILLDILMPEMNGFELLREIRKLPDVKDIPVIFLTGELDNKSEVEALEYGAVDFIRKPFEPQIILSRINTHLQLHRYQTNLEDAIRKERKKLEKLSFETVTTIANAVDARDVYTKQHSSRVALYAKLIAQQLGWDESRCENLYNVALLHDIGKIGVPDRILNKPGRLTDEEYEIMKKHVEIGAEILGKISYIDNVMEVARYHHERYDGNGYASGLKGKEIPVEARIVNIADAFDAMTSDRIYRTKRSMDYVLDELRKGRGTQFDPDLANIFINLITEEKDCG